MPTNRKPRIKVYRPADKLRVGRLSIPGRCYFVTKKILDRRNPIIHDLNNPCLDDATCSILIDSLKWLSQNRRIRCHACVVMADHIHIQFTLRRVQALSQVMSSYFTWTSRNINRLRRRTGRFWAPEFHDVRIRSSQSFWAHINYIRQNPVKAGYVESPGQWPYVEVFPEW